MDIKHEPIFKTQQLEKLYSDKDGVPVKYVCTTEFQDISLADIFYRETPHPEFGNKYFALYMRGKDLMITNADSVESLWFGLVENDDKCLEYSSHRHDFKKFNNGNMIDGGRAYIKSSGCVQTYVIRDGQMVPKNNERT